MHIRALDIVVITVLRSTEVDARVPRTRAVEDRYISTDDGSNVSGRRTLISSWNVDVMDGVKE